MVIACAGHGPDPGAAQPVRTPSQLAPRPAAMSNADPIATFTNGKLRLRVEAVREDVVHFELAAASSPASASIATSPMIARREQAIAWTRRSDATLETRELEI